MASLLALEITGDRIHALRLEGGTGKVNVRKSMSVQLPKPLTTANASELGSWLRKQLTDHGLGTGDIAACLGRGQATFRQLHIPDVPANELVGVIQLAVDAESDGASLGVLDYDVGPVERGQRYVTVAFAPQRTVDALQECLKAAGLNPLRLTVRPYAMKFLKDRLAPGTDNLSASMLLAPSADGFDISVWDRNRLEIARTIYPNGAAPHENAQKLAAELKRTLASFQLKHPNTEISSIAAVTGDATDYASSIESSLNTSLAVVDPASKISSFGDASALGAVGAGWELLANATPAIDLFHPKKAPPPKYSTKRLAIIGGLLAAVVLGAGLFWQQRQIAHLEQQIEDTRSEITKIDNEIKQRKPEDERHAEISKWIAQRVDWLEELNELSYRLPATEKAFLTSLHGTVTHSGKTPVGEIQLDVRADDSNSVTESQRRLGENGRFKVQVKTSKSNNDVEQFKHNESFDLRFATATQPSMPTKKSQPAPKRELAQLKSDQRRTPINLDSKKKPATAMASNDRLRNTRRAETREAASNTTAAPGSTASSSGDTSGQKQLDAKVERLKTLPLDEFERELLKEKRFLQGRLRKMVEEARGKKS